MTEIITRDEYENKVRSVDTRTQVLDCYIEFYSQFATALTYRLLRDTLERDILQSKNPDSFSDIPPKRWLSLTFRILNTMNLEKYNAANRLNGSAVGTTDIINIAKATAYKLRQFRDRNKTT